MKISRCCKWQTCKVWISVILLISIRRSHRDGPIMAALQSAVARYNLWIFKRIQWT